VNFSLENERLYLLYDSEKSEQLKDLQGKILAALADTIEEKKVELETLSKRASSQERESQIQLLESESQAFIKLRNLMIAGFEKSKRLHEKIASLYKEYQEQQKASER
ncbi:MAG: hypothetical protein WD595_06855, partial [Waddliaceae bacterium]